MTTNTRTGVNQPNQGGYLYPFVSDWDAVAATIVDLRVGYDPSVHKLPLKLDVMDNITGSPVFPGFGGPRLVISDANDVIVVDTGELKRPNINGQEWASRYKLYTWGVAPYGLSVVTDSVIAPTLPTILIPNGKEIDVRACEPIRSFVRNIKIYDNQEVELAEVSNSDLLKWYYGHNVELQYTPAAAQTFSGQRVSETVTINMSPGSGLGRYDTCQDAASLPIRTLGGAKPDNKGDVAFATERCFRVEPLVEINGDLAHIVPGIVRLGDDCKACCDCADYQNVYRAMSRTKRKYEALGTALTPRIEKYDESRQFIAERLQCVSSSSLLKLAAAATGAGEIGIAAGLCNPSGQNITGVSLRVSVYQVYSNGTAARVPTGSTASYSPLLRNNIPTTYSDVLQSGDDQLIFFDCVNNNETVHGILRLTAEIEGMAQVCVEVDSWNPEDSTIAPPTKICTLVNMNSLGSGLAYMGANGLVYGGDELGYTP